MESKKNDINLIKKSYDIRFNQIKSQFLKKHNSSNFLKQNSKLCDDVLKKLWILAYLDDSFCLVAVGGYGRKSSIHHQTLILQSLPIASIQLISTMRS